MWFDNPDSLSIRYGYAKKMGLKGVGPFTFDYLDYLNETNNPHAYKQTQDMWNAFSAFLSNDDEKQNHHHSNEYWKKLTQWEIMKL